MAPAGRSSVEGVRRANLEAVLRNVHLNGPMTRAELAAVLGLNRSTIRGLTAALADHDLVAESAAGASRGARGGRPSHLVTPRSDNTVAAIDIGTGSMRVALVGLGGSVLGTRSTPLRPEDRAIENVADLAAQFVKDLLVTLRPTRLLGVAASVPGAVRRRDGLVLFAPNLGWHGEPLATLLTARLGIDALVGNDASLAMLAEHLRGAAVGYEHAVYVSAHVGLGGGVLVHGEVLQGADGYAGEIGHLQVDVTGPPCRCGAVGCWEMKVDERALLTRAGRPETGGSELVDEVIAAANAGERQAQDAVAETARWMAVGLRMLINLYNPQAIVLGGTLAQVWNGARDLVEDALRCHRPLAPLEDVAIMPGRLSADSSLVGAAELIFSRAARDPLAIRDESRTRRAEGADPR